MDGYIYIYIYIYSYIKYIYIYICIYTRQVGAPGQFPLRASHGAMLSVALETENTVFETVFWLKRQNGKWETQ